MTNVLHLFPEPAPVAEPSRFEEIWRIWPNRAKKVVAKAKYDAIIRGGFQTRTLDRDSNSYVEIELAGDHDRILAGVKAYLQSQKASGSGAYGYIDGGKWIPHLATFLNQGRWEDWL
jgi:hypothetical protein